MGACCANDNMTKLDAQLSFDNKSTNKSIKIQMQQSEKKDNKIIKLLLLGAGSSGKSTLFRQIESIHGDNYTYNDDGNTQFFQALIDIKHDIKTNCLVSITKLLLKSYDLSVEPYNFTECKVDTNNEEIANAIKIITNESKRHDRENDIKCPNLTQVGELIHFVWNLKEIQNTWQKRQYFSLIENINLFLDKIKDIFCDDDEYIPDRNDVIFSRIRTIGVLKREYLIQNTTFHMYDVGGQRSERKKWISLFDNSDALIFVVALNGYCSVIFEDETVNKMKESLNLFGEQCNGPHFTSSKTQFILFLNKNDLFEERLKAGMKLSLCFGDQWIGSNYCDKNDDDFKDKNERQEWFNVCYSESIDFITKQFLEQNNNPKITSIFTHITTATDQNNIEIVFTDVRTAIIQRNLAKIGVTYHNGMR